MFKLWFKWLTSDMRHWRKNSQVPKPDASYSRDETVRYSQTVVSRKEEPAVKSGIARQLRYFRSSCCWKKTCPWGEVINQRRIIWNGRPIRGADLQSQGSFPIWSLICILHPSLCQHVHVLQPDTLGCSWQRWWPGWKRMLVLNTIDHTPTW